MKIISDGGVLNDSNTMDAILLSKNLNYLDGLKLDIYKTLDNILVVASSNNLSDFSLGKGNINELSYNYLRKVKFSSHIFKYYIPTLEEVLKNYNYDKLILLDLHIYGNEEKYLEILGNILNKYPYEYFIIYSYPLKIYKKYIK